MSWIQTIESGVLINLRVVPRASKDEIAGVHGDALKIRLRVPPVEGKANRHLMKLLAASLDIARNSISIVSGEKSRNKRVLVTGMDERAVKERLK
jgi:uncharacterized protein (TIGR00251 family)